MKLLAAAILVLTAWATACASGSTPGTADGWGELGPQARCDRALSLVTHPDRWPLTCRWRTPEDLTTGQAFPPPPGPPPFDEPRVEVYVGKDDTREQLASIIGHELGHMHHTRVVTFAQEWLAARNLPADTAWEVWTEDYAEVFATLFAPPADRWRAPTPRPSPGALALLRGRFFG